MLLIFKFLTTNIDNLKNTIQILVFDKNKNVLQKKNFV